MTNLTSSVQSTVVEHPDRSAVAFKGDDLTYDALWSRIEQFATALESVGVGEGDRVAIYLPNVPQFVTAFHGTLAVGGIVVPMNPQYKSREIEHLLSDSEAKVVVTLDDLVPFVDEVRENTDIDEVVSVGGSSATSFERFLEPGDLSVTERGDDAIAVMPYTSGTTGQPKGVRLTHHNLKSNTDMTAQLIPEGVRPDDSALGVLPLFHIYGMTVVMNATLFNGGTFHALPAWDAQQALSLIEDEELTIMHGVPAMYNDIINQPNAEEFDLSSLRLAGVGGSGIPLEVLHHFEDLYDVNIYEGYGLTETSPVTHFNSPVQGRRVGSIGRAVPGVEAMVVDEDLNEVDPVVEGPIDEDAVELDDITGEILVSGPNVMAGYYELPQATEEAFTEIDGTEWFHTGDIGYHDEDGYFYVVDRAKHVIVTGGYNVYPREVEELLFEHEAVADAAVVGISDDRRGETVKAYIVTTPGAEVTEDAIKEYCLERLAAYKHPREVEFVDDLPRTTTGKVQKFELRKREKEPTEPTAE